MSLSTRSGLVSFSSGTVMGDLSLPCVASSSGKGWGQGSGHRPIHWVAAGLLMGRLVNARSGDCRLRADKTPTSRIRRYRRAGTPQGPFLVRPARPETYHGIGARRSEWTPLPPIHKPQAITAASSPLVVGARLTYGIPRVWLSTAALFLLRGTGT